MSRDSRHSAQYDAEGNIILPVSDTSNEKETMTEQTVAWTDIPDLEDEPSIFEKVSQPMEVPLEAPKAEPGMSAEEYIVKVPTGLKHLHVLMEPMSCAAKAVQQHAAPLEEALRNTIENRPYTAVAVALAIGWFIGRMSRMD